MKTSILVILFSFSTLWLKVEAQLTAGGDTTICRGGQAQLWASGGGVSYHWTAYPPDPSLFIPQQQNPVVSPVQNTMYVVQSNIATGNLILNGSFELGNIGFNSEYIYNPNSIVDEGTYAVVSDAHTVHSSFFCDEDHTSGSGLFMAVNGSGTANTEVWYLNLQNIQPNNQYEFSTWITSLHPTNPAVLQFSINGQLMAEPFHAYTTACDWYQFFHVWDSDTNTQATISIVNQNTVPNGNDFALDDISFATVLVYFDTVWVEVLPQLTSDFNVAENACVDQVVNIEFTGNGADTNNFHWDFGGATVLSGSGPGPYEVSWNYTGLDSVSLWLEDEEVCSSDTTYHFVSVFEPPVAGVSADNTNLLPGESTLLHGNMQGGSGNLSFTWSPETLLMDPDSLDTETLPLIQTTLFTLTVIDEATGCDSTVMITIEVEGSGLAATALAAPPEICIGDSSQLFAQVSGGTGNYNFLWSSEPPWFESDLQDPLVFPEGSTTFLLEVSDGSQTIYSSVDVVVNPLPMADAGPDQTIPYGSYTTLDGTASYGSGGISFLWEPGELLDDQTVPSPLTVELTQNSMFTLTVTDQQSLCESTKDTVFVYMDGGPMSISIFSDHEEICSGDTATLTGVVSGGVPGNYSFTWKDNAGNIISQENKISVSPEDTSTFFLMVSDGFSVQTESYDLPVKPSPEFSINDSPGPYVFCPYDTAVLRIVPSPAEWNYYWSNGSTSPVIHVGTTGIGFDSKSYQLTVTTESGCTSESNVTVFFDFSACLGLDENSGDYLQVYPNPARDHFMIRGNRIQDIEKVEVLDAMGRRILPVTFTRNSKERITISFGNDFQVSGMLVVRILFKDRLETRKLILYK